MDIYGSENDFYGLIGRPNITVVQPSSKEITFHYNDDEDNENSYDNSYSSNGQVCDNIVVKEENLSNDTNYHQGFVDLNYQQNHGGETKKLHYNSTNVHTTLYNNGGSPNKMLYSNDPSSFNGRKQYQILEQKKATGQRQQNAPNSDRFHNEFSQQANFNGQISSYQNTAVDNTSNESSDGSLNGTRFQFQQPQGIASQAYQGPNGIYSSHQVMANNNFQGQAIQVTGTTKGNNKKDTKMINNSHKQTNKDKLDELKSTDGEIVDRPLEPEVDAEGKGSVVCPICGVTYSKYYYNLKHRFFHSGKKYDCSICGRSFNHQHNMYRHKRVHEDINDYQYHCGEDKCDMVFKTHTGLKRHMQMKHSMALSSTTPVINEQVNKDEKKEAKPPTKRRRRRKNADFQFENSLSNDSSQSQSNEGRNNYQHDSVVPQVSNTLLGGSSEMSAINTTTPAATMMSMPNIITTGPHTLTTSNTLPTGQQQHVLPTANTHNIPNPSQTALSPPPTSVIQSHALSTSNALPTTLTNSMVPMMQPLQPVNQTYYNHNKNQPFQDGYNTLSSAMPIPQLVFNNNNNNKNFEDLKSIPVSSAISQNINRPMPMNESVNQNFQDPSQSMMLPNMALMHLPVAPPGYNHGNQTYINNENQNVKSSSPPLAFHEFPVPLSKETPNQQHKTDLKKGNREKEPSNMTNGNKNTAVTCHICDKEFSVHYIREHLDHHAGRRYTCYICGLVFYSRDKLKRHKRQHENKSDYDPYCGECKLYFPSEKKLAFHNKKIHTVVPKKDTNKIEYTIRNNTRDPTTTIEEDMIQSDNNSVILDNDRKIQIGQKFYYKCLFCNGCYKSKRSRDKHQSTHMDTVNVKEEVQASPDDRQDGPGCMQNNNIQYNPTAHNMLLHSGSNFAMKNESPLDISPEYNGSYYHSEVDGTMYNSNSSVIDGNKPYLPQHQTTELISNDVNNQISENFEHVQNMNITSSTPQDHGIELANFNSNSVKQESSLTINNNKPDNCYENEHKSFPESYEDGQNVENTANDNEDDTEINLHMCPYCDSIFKKEVVLQRHISLHQKKMNADI